MDNFLDFIKRDIKAKKMQISALPTKTQTDQKKYDETLQEIKKKYAEYARYVRAYMSAKKDALSITKENRFDRENAKKVVSDLEYLKFLLNPANSYFEKMGFDSLLYELTNYYIFKSRSLIDIINSFLDKFEQANIVLTGDDFTYTCYVHEYMSEFLKARKSDDKSYMRMREIFEQIYWFSPEIIEHIELNLRRLIRQNAKVFSNYIEVLQKETMEKCGIKNYSQCLENLSDAYIDLNLATTEDINDILDLVQNGSIDIENYKDDSETIHEAFNSLILDRSILASSDEMDKTCNDLEKLKNNIEEYSDYLDFSAFFKYFKEQYSESVKVDNKKSRALSDTVLEIKKRENELYKINRKIFNSKSNLYEYRTDPELKRLKSDSVKRANELYTLYKEYDNAYFKDKVLSTLNPSMSVADLLELYSSFDYYKKRDLQIVYKISDYEHLRMCSINFDRFTLNPRNIIIKGMSVFDSSDIPKVIVNRYSFGNINIKESNLKRENLKYLWNDIQLVLRYLKIKNSPLSIEQISFIVESHLLLEENK